jgi:FkbM family methyltransferase
MVTPTKAVQLRIPDSEIEMILCGSVADRGTIGAVVAQKGYYQPHVVVRLFRLVQENASCIEVGAHIGAISLQLSKIASKGHIYSFEPTSTSFQFLLQNIAANSISNITAYNVGISDRAHDLALHDLADLSGCSFVYTNAHPSEMSAAKAVPIHCVSLDEWVSKNNIPKIDFIKLDVEGMEQAVLRGANRLLLRDKPDLAIEFNPHANDDSSRQLYEALRHYWSHIFVMPRDISNSLIPIRDFDHLMLLIKAGPGCEDLFCTNREAREGAVA